MATLVLTRGIPASGKSTWAKEWVAEDPDRRRRVNRDDLRAMLYGTGYAKPDSGKEQEVTRIQHEIVRTFLRAGLDVVVDDTNLKASFVRDWYKELGPDDKGEFVDFPVTVDQAVFRDAQRASKGGRMVGREVIESFASRFLVKGKLPQIPPIIIGDGRFQPYSETPGLPHAILVDIDGTLAHITPGGRSPYDGTRVHEDIYDTVIGNIVESYSTSNDRWVFVVSGRDEEFREVTENWLKLNNVQYDKLFMRPLGDRRKDDVIKDEIFEREFAGKYNVDFILDDRDRVVKMWRSKGLKVLQVAPGDF